MFALFAFSLQENRDSVSFSSNSTECPDGRYGQNCSESCGHCLGNSSCNHATGQCADGCLPGYDYMADNTCKTSETV